MQADIVIVGAGLVGSTLALALKHTPLNIMILEADNGELSPITANSLFQPRVSAISLGSQNILQSINAWPDIIACRASAYQQMYVWDGSGTGHIHFSNDMVHQSCLGHIIENDVIRNALLMQLKQTHINLRTDVQLESLVYDGKKWQVTLSSGETISTTLIIGADGANSKVRHCAQIKSYEWNYLHHAIVTSVRCEKTHQKTAWQRFTDHGPLAFLPLSLMDDEHWCSIVWSSPPEKANALMAIDDKDFNLQLAREFEYKLGAITDVNQRYNIGLRQRHVYRYTKPGLALIGDAAHVIHPLAGQGVNLGFMDAATLAEVLQNALQCKENIGSEQVLRRFERKRKLHNMGMTAAMELLERLFQTNNLAMRWLRNKGLDWVDSQAQLKASLIQRAMGIEGALPRIARSL